MINREGNIDYAYLGRPGKDVNEYQHARGNAQARQRRRDDVPSGQEACEESEDAHYPSQ